VSDVQLEVLHDHYKESFSYIRDREKQRDRLFLIVLGLLTLIAVEILYPADFDGALGRFELSGAQVDISSLPLAAILGSSWMFTFALSLRYCQVCINVERQYEYLHGLEEKISKQFGDAQLYSREGKSYLEDYPLFSDWAWICYVFIFPLIVVLVIATLLIVEWTALSYSLPYKLFDSLTALAVITSFFLYRLLPGLPGSVLDRPRVAIKAWFWRN
jgi:hypothetical protein